MAELEQFHRRTLVLPLALRRLRAPNICRGGVGEAMGKNNRKRRKQKQRMQARKAAFRGDKPAKSLAPVLRRVSNPFMRLNDQAKRDAVAAMVARGKVLLQESRAAIGDILTRHNPETLLAILALYGLVRLVRESDDAPADSATPQAHVEMCQAIALTYQSNQFKGNAVAPMEVQRLFDASRKLFEAHQLSSFEAINFDADSEQREILGLQELMRGHTKTVRNWGTNSQVRELSAELYLPLDAMLDEAVGFSCSDIFKFFSALEERFSGLAQERFDLLRELAMVRDKREILKAYCALCEFDSDLDGLAKKLNIDQMSRRDVRLFCMSHLDLSASDLCEFSIAEMAEKSNLDVQKVQAILHEYSLDYGSLAQANEQHFFLSNPVWNRPIIRVGAEIFFCAMPQLFFSFVIPNMEKVFPSELRPRVSNRRAEYLEKKIESIFLRRFPEASVESKVKWRHDGRQYETDLLVQIDSFLIIVEAKSGRVSEPALRGAPNRMKRNIEELFLEPNEQSLRLKNKIERVITGEEIDEDFVRQFPVALDSVKRIVRLSVSLEDFGALQSNLKQHVVASWLPEGFEPCPSLNLADFETLFDFLEHPVQIIHYLLRRSEMEGQFSYIGDELDLMGLYIQTQFSMGMLTPEDQLVITGMSEALDSYYNARDIGKAQDKPQPLVSPLFKSILSQLESRKTYRWTEMGVVLNCFSPDDQRSMLGKLGDLKRIVSKNWRTPDHLNSLILVPAKTSHIACVFTYFTNGNRNERHRYMENAASKALEKEHITQCIVIGKNIERTDTAYDAIALYGADYGLHEQRLLEQSDESEPELA